MTLQYKHKYTWHKWGRFLNILLVLLLSLSACSDYERSIYDPNSPNYIGGVIDETAEAEAVDLGLSVKWASWNVGATAPEEYGGYYAWGETEVKDNYDWSTYKWYNGTEYTITKYCTDSKYGVVDNKTTLDPEDDVAHVKWGGAWRMPTSDEIKELIDKCTWSRTSQNGVNGHKVIGPNGNSIFLPTVGYRKGTEVIDRTCGYYWSGTLDEYGSDYAYYLGFNSGLHDRGSSYRGGGFSVRPVQDNKSEEEPEKEASLSTELYIIGNDFGNWDWASDGVVEMTPVHSHPGHFWATRYITAANGFLFCPKKEWNGFFTNLGNDSGYEVKDGICFVAEDGFYTIYIDLANNIVAIEPAVVYGIGDCFGGWDVAMGESKFVAEDTTLVSPATVADGNLRMYTASPSVIEGVDWWQMEFNVFDSTIVYRGAGNDQEAVAVTAGQKVTLDFNAGTGAINGSAVDDEPVFDEPVVAEAVDLGLSVKWASWNVGATAPEEYGDYYAWGETGVKDNYDWSTYKWCNGTSNSITKYCTVSDYGVVDNKIMLDPEDDVAHVKWGGEWRMPTSDEIKELTDKCSWRWTTQNGVKGHKVTGPNGNSIFLPAAGYRIGTEVFSHGSGGLYWSGTLYEYNSIYASYLDFYDIGWNWNDSHRDNGFSVRPVQDKDPVEEEPIETIAGVLALGEGKTVKTQGTIVATHAHGILLHDETGYIHVRLNANTDNVVGDVVTVKGNLTPWGGLLEFATGATIEKVGTAEIVHPEPIVWDGATLDSYLTSPKIQYVQYTGVLKISGGFYNITVGDANTAVGRVSQSSDGLLSEEYVGQSVKLTGYTVGSIGGKYVETMVTAVEMVVDETSVAEAVDLGLSVKWASWNMGATKPEGYGGYYAWGETRVKDSYDGSTYKWGNGTSWNISTITKYCTDSKYGVVDNKTILDPQDDVAQVNWGDAWRMPTLDEIRELIKECTWSCTTQNYVKGYKVTGPNGNSIFLPAGGSRNGTMVKDCGSDGLYWSGALGEFRCSEAFYLGFDCDNGYHGGYYRERFYGHTVRPVQDKDPVEEEPIVETIAGVLASGEGKTVKTQGTIVATHAYGILLHDETGYIHVRLEANDNAVGDVVTVKGNLASYGGLLEFATGAIIKRISAAEVVHPEPAPLYGPALDSYLANPKIQYVQYTGVLGISDGFYTVGGANTAVGRVLQSSDGLLSEEHVSLRVKLTGYTVGSIGGKYVETMVTAVEVLEKPVDETSVAKAVDLGLSVKWASWNMGATKPEGYGGHYAWGETEVKDNYDWSTYKWCNGTEYTITKYCTDSKYGVVDNKTTLDPEDDVAHVKWGGAWRMPTSDEIKELIDKCTWSRTSQNGVNGHKVTGPNGNSIFLPAAGYRDGTEVYLRGPNGYYWSGTLGEDGGSGAYGLFFYFVDSRWHDCDSRSDGRLVRPVTD